MGPEVHHGGSRDAVRDHSRSKLPRHQVFAVSRRREVGNLLLNGPFSDVGCKTVANMIKGKTPEEIRKLFNIVNDFTPEEEVRDHTKLH